MPNTHTATEHKIRWYVLVWNAAGTRKERLPHTATMRGSWNYEATCSCGWETHTGGALRRYVAELVREHKDECAA